MSACARRSATTWSSLESSSSSRRIRRCSLVAPEGPAAAPRRAHRSAAKSCVAGSGHASAGWKAATSGARGAYGSAGRRPGSRNSASVASVPGASGSATRARAAAKSSPKCTRAAARHALPSGLAITSISAAPSVTSDRALAGAAARRPRPQPRPRLRRAEPELRGAARAETPMLRAAIGQARAPCTQGARPRRPQVRRLARLLGQRVAENHNLGWACLNAVDELRDTSIWSHQAVGMGNPGEQTCEASRLCRLGRAKGAHQLAPLRDCHWVCLPRPTARRSHAEEAYRATSIRDLLGPSGAGPLPATAAAPGSLEA